MRRRATRVAVARDGLVLARHLIAQGVDLLLYVDDVVDHEAHLRQVERVLLGYTHQVVIVR